MSRKRLIATARNSMTDDLLDHVGSPLP